MIYIYINVSRIYALLATPNKNAGSTTRGAWSQHVQRALHRWPHDQCLCVLYAWMSPMRYALGEMIGQMEWWLEIWNVKWEYAHVSHMNMCVRIHAHTHMYMYIYIYTCIYIYIYDSGSTTNWYRMHVDMLESLQREYQPIRPWSPKWGSWLNPPQIRWETAKTLW